MASDYKFRFRQFLPGAGFDSAGNPAQGKTRVVGSCAVTSYTRGGEALAPMDVGLVAIDSIHLRVHDQVAGTSGEDERKALYNQTQDQFYLVTMGPTGVMTERANAATETVEFDCFGDSAHNVELT